MWSGLPQLRAINKKKAVSYLLLAVVLTSIVAVAAHTVGPFEVSVNDGARFNASDSGPTIWFATDVTVESGNPFVDANTINVSTDQGIVNVSSTTATEARFDTVNGTWTNVSQLSVSSGNLTINPHDKNASTVGGGLTAFSYRNDMAVNDSATDFHYTSTGDGTVIVEVNASDGVQYGAIDQDTNEGLDVAVANGQQLAFTGLDSGTHEVRLDVLGTLDIREESSPHPLITGNVTATFFEDTNTNPTIQQLSTSTGSLDLTGLPVDEQFTVEVKVAGGQYHNRTFVIDDLTSQDTIFLLNTNRTSVNNTFQLDDGTGEFSSEDNTKLFLEHAINQSEYATGGWEWLVIGGDDLGAQQLFQIDLQHEDRYRLRVTNDDGDERVLGEYNAEASGVVILTVGNVNLTPTRGTTYAWNATFNESGSNFIRFSFEDTDDDTTDLNLRIYEFGNESNTFAVDLNNAGPFGTFSFSQQATGAEVNTTWVVEWNATRAGETIGGKDVVGRQNIGPTLPLDAVWLEVGSVGALVLVAGAVGGLLNPAVGALVLAMFGGLLWQLGFLPAEIGGGAIVLAFLVAASWLVMSNRSEP